jgi:hypothetical protein
MARSALNGTEDVLEAARAMARLGRPWFISGGWAIDLHLGRVTREHHDVDILVLRSDQLRVQTLLADWRLNKIIPHPQGLMNQGTLARWEPGERLELPVHQVDVHRAGDDAIAFQVMLGESSGDRWIYRRNPAVTHPLVSLGFHPLWGLPYLAPEIVLLFKAKLMQPHDRADFAAAAPTMSTEAKAWLREALIKCHPGHKWLAAL